MSWPIWERNKNMTSRFIHWRNGGMGSLSFTVKFDHGRIHLLGGSWVKNLVVSLLIIIVGFTWWNMYLLVISDITLFLSQSSVKVPKFKISTVIGPSTLMSLSVNTGCACIYLVVWLWWIWRTQLIYLCMYCKHHSILWCLNGSQPTVCKCFIVQEKKRAHILEIFYVVKIK